MVSAPSRKRHGRNQRQVDLFTLGVDELKSLIHSRLNVEKPGPGYCHFPISDDYDAEYFAQLASEKVQTKMKMGVPTRVWIQTRPRNEVFDCHVYGHAALILLRPDFEALAARLDPPEQTEDTKEVTENVHRPTRPTRRGGFVNGWR